MRARLVAWALLWAWITGAPRVRAEPAAPAPRAALRVVLILDRPNDLFAERIRAEVAGVGLAVLALEPWRTREALGPPEEIARAHGAAATIRMLPTRKGVEIWMADATSGRSLLRQVVVDDSAGGPNQGLVALQTAELLRTSLLSPPSGPPVPPSPPPSAAPAVTAVAATAAASPEARHGGVQAAVGFLVSRGGAGAALQGWLSLQQAFARRWGLALDLSGPLRAGTASGPEGTARVGAYLAGAALLLRLDQGRARAFGVAGLGFGVARVGADGQAAPPLVATSQRALTAAAYLRADAGVGLTRWLRLGVRIVAGATAAHVALRFAGNDAGRWGRPFGGALALVELDWR